MKKMNAIFIAQAAMIAAFYVVLTYVSNLAGLASGVIQVRLSEALTILPFFTPAAIPGLAIGCFLSNVLTGCALFDVIFGSIATLIGAIGTYFLRKYKWLAPVTPILANILIIPYVLQVAYGIEDSYWFLMLTIGIGELISAGILGMILLFSLEKNKLTIFPTSKF